MTHFEEALLNLPKRHQKAVANAILNDTIEESLGSQHPLLRPEHDSLQPKRLKKNGLERSVCNAERVYAAEWKRLNSDHNSLSPSALELILAPDGKLSNVPTASRRDAAVAASIIQWLATTVGHGFLLGCERKVGQSDFIAARDHENDWSEQMIRASHRQKRTSARQAFVNRSSKRTDERECARAVRVKDMAAREEAREKVRLSGLRAVHLREA